MEERFAVGQIVCHFKRNEHHKGLEYLYVYLGTAQHTETGEKLVIYKELYGTGKLYARPAYMFFGLVDKDIYPEARQKYRFEMASIEDIMLAKKAANDVGLI